MFPIVSRTCRRMALTATLVTSCVTLAGQTASPVSLLVRDVTLVDGNGGPPRPNVDVLVRAGRIVSVASSIPPPVERRAAWVLNTSAERSLRTESRTCC